jgi:glycolate oxidase FAD binding subunit
MTPQTAEELAGLIREASERGQPLVPWGAGTLQHLGHPPPSGACLLHTAALNRIVEYNPADLTITVEAGATIGAVQETLRPYGQWLPWDPPAPDYATIGGLLAAGVSGPLRLGYGTPRDWALGMRVALGDGRLVKSGGKVVKNVAGYDTHKLHIGALGTLGVVVQVTLKVAPLPERAETRAFACWSRAVALGLAERLRERPLAPASLIVWGGQPGPHEGRGARATPGVEECVVAVRFAGVAAAAERQARAAAAAARAAGARQIELDGERVAWLWREVAQFSAVGAAGAARDEGIPDNDIIIRAGARPASLGRVLEAIEGCAPQAQRPQAIGYAGVGLAYARWSSSEGDTVAAALARLRAALAAEEGYAVVEDAPADLRRRIDLWGEPPPTVALMRALKTQWDPRGVLNRGRYVGSL